MKKNLGQHFLHSVSALKKIVNEARLSPKDVVLEIGPGKGALTQMLLEKTEKIIAVEKDPKLALFLKEKFSKEIAASQLVLLEEDIRNVGPSPSKFIPSAYKLVANIPYYLTGYTLKAFIGGKMKPSSAVLLLQKEVVERIVARDNKESVLSISLKAYGSVKKIGIVKRGLFNPKPTVDSAILSVTNISEKFFDGISEEKFFEVVKKGFGQKRKKLINNLKAYNTKKVAEAFQICSLTENVRAEDVPLLKWKCLASKLPKKSVTI